MAERMVSEQDLSRALELAEGAPCLRHLDRTALRYLMSMAAYDVDQYPRFASKKERTTSMFTTMVTSLCLGHALAQVEAEHGGKHG